ncbi:MAG: SH3 domain-containing protein [Anaerolineae bacterium]|nr:SH3 domain-containing protein [Anaerolineae bacterium]
MPVSWPAASLLASLPVHLGFAQGALLRDGDQVYYFDRPADLAPSMAGLYANVIPVSVGVYREADVLDLPPGVLAVYEEKTYLETTKIRLNGATSAANVRQEPSLDRPVVGIIERTESITAYGRTTDNLWLLIAYQKQFGWLAADLVAPDPALSLLPTEAVLEAMVEDLPQAQPAAVVEKQSVEPGPVYCSSVPIRGFGQVWGEHPEIQATLNCPSGNEQGTKAAVQIFERGLMLWLEADSVYRSDPVYVFFEDGNYQRFGNLGPADPAKVGAIPTGFSPVGDRFGKVYWEGTGAQVKEHLGYALGPAQDTAGAFQQFYNGRMFWTEALDRIFILYDYYYYDENDDYIQVRSWLSYEDTF